MQRLGAMSPIQNLVDGYSDFCTVSSTIGKNKLPITPNITIVFFICTIRVGKNASSIAVFDMYSLDIESTYDPWTDIATDLKKEFANRTCRCGKEERHEKQTAWFPYMHVGDSRSKTGKRTLMVRWESTCVTVFPRGFWILLTTKVSLRRKKTYFIVAQRKNILRKSSLFYPPDLYEFI
jgi:hypothetical protein